MKLVTFINPEGNARVGAIAKNSSGASIVVDVDQAYRTLQAQGDVHPGMDLSPLKDMMTVILMQDRSKEMIEEVLKNLSAGKLADDLPCLLEESNTRLLSPVPRPVSVRDGYAFRQHVETMRKSRGMEMIPEFDNAPILYFSNHMAVTGPGDLAISKKSTAKTDYELEVAIIIGREGRNIKASEADDYIFGYMIMNDWSDRHVWLTHESKMSLGPTKSKDFATSLGPYLVTPDELKDVCIPSDVGNRHDIEMKCSVNGKVYSSGNLKTMSWTFAQLIEFASDGVMLYPGEVIGSGTVGTGCFAELNLSKVTDGMWLQDGDEVVCDVDRLGQLKNKLSITELG